MQNKKKTIVITILIWAGFIPYCSFATSTSDTKSKHPTAFELLDRYAKNQDKLNSFIARTESVSTHSSQDAPAQQAKMRRTMVEFRYEESGSDLKVYYWFRYDFNRGEDGIWIPADRCHSVLWDGKHYYERYQAAVLDSSKLYVTSDEDEFKRAIAVGYQGAGSLLGTLYGDLEPFDSILRQSDSKIVKLKVVIKTKIARQIGGGHCGGFIGRLDGIEPRPDYRKKEGQSQDNTKNIE